MAHFAKIGMNGKVLQTVVVDNSDMLDANGVEDESVGQQFLEINNNWPAQMWIQTSYNTMNNQHKLGGTPFRGNYASIGYEWDEDNNIFWPKKPYASWTKDIATADWISPAGAMPQLTDEQQSQTTAGTHNWIYNWDEDGQSWNLVNTEE